MAASINDENAWTIGPLSDANEKLRTGKVGGSSLTGVSVTDDDRAYFVQKTASIKGTTITVNSVQPPAAALEPGETYSVAGKSGGNNFGPVKAIYMSKSGSTYRFEKAK